MDKMYKAPDPIRQIGWSNSQSYSLTVRPSVSPQKQTSLSKSIKSQRTGPTIIDLISSDDDSDVSSESRTKFRRLNHDPSRASTDIEKHNVKPVTDRIQSSPPPKSRSVIPVVPSSVPTKRGRGRPRKERTSPPPPKKPRGRPRKYPLPLPNVSESLSTISAQPRSDPQSWRVNIEDSKTWMRRHLSTSFVRQLTNLQGPSLTMVNTVDDEGPPTSFTFIQEYVFQDGTKRLEPAARYGCNCRVQNGRDVGCEYTSCECIEDAGDEFEKLGFPYHAVNEQKGTLRNKYLNSRHMIYECNELCSCPPHCKNKVVQKGRQIPLDIFKTKSRGWALRSPADIMKGQFVDVYLGEMITDAEACRREESSTIQKNSYLFALDKFKQSNATSRSPSTSDTDSLVAPDNEDGPDPDLFVVDGEHMGGPTRFINHSCDPNLRIFTVSLYRGDSRVYELAFFAIEDIKAGTELTFDYVDHEQEEDNDQPQGKVKCLCGAEDCRGWLWI